MEKKRRNKKIKEKIKSQTEVVDREGEKERELATG